MRYRLLESVRQYPTEQLAAADEEEATRDSHLAYCLALAEQAIQALRGAEAGAWLDRLETEHDNMRAALAWATATARARRPVAAPPRLAPLWEMRRHIAEGRRRLEEPLSAFHGSPGGRARALNAVGFLVMRSGDARSSLALYQQSLALRRDLGDTRSPSPAWRTRTSR